MIPPKYAILLAMKKNDSPRTGFTNSDGCSGIEALGRTDTPNGGSWLCIVYRSTTTPGSQEAFVYEVSLIRGSSERFYYIPAASSRFGKPPEGFDVGYEGQ
jgi:hypothetical protein